MKKRQYFAVHHYEIIPCHVIAKKDRAGDFRFAADSRRDRRRFSSAYGSREEASAAVESFEKSLLSRK